MFGDKHVTITREKLGSGTSWAKRLTRIEKPGLSDCLRQSSSSQSETGAGSSGKGSLAAAPQGSLSISVD